LAFENAALNLFKHFALVRCNILKDARIEFAFGAHLFYFVSERQNLKTEN